MGPVYVASHKLYLIINRSTITCLKPKKTKKIDIKNIGVDIDKNEYKEIVLSQSNQPEKNFYERYD